LATEPNSAALQREIARSHEMRRLLQQRRADLVAALPQPSSSSTVLRDWYREQISSIDKEIVGLDARIARLGQQLAPGA
jgi:predicted  nucleic acid-binding Zn-ribbon protein